MRPPLLPALAGLLLVLSFPPFPLGPLCFVALVPLAVYVGEREPGPGGAAALQAGFAMGIVFFGGLLYWIAFSFPDRFWLGPPAFLISVAFLALYLAGVAWLLQRALHGRRLPVWLVLPFVWTSAEWLRGVLPGGFAFPWAGLPLSLTGFPRALGLAAWTGEHGVTFWIALVNGLFATALVKARQGMRRAWVPAAAALLVAAAPFVLAGAGAEAPVTGADIRVAVVQTSVTQQIREDPEAGARAMAATLERLLPPLAPHSVDLVILPETAFPIALEAPQARPYVDLLRGHALRLEAPILVGAFGLGDARPGRRAVYNSVFVVDSTGLHGRYDKRHLVPGVERTPLLPSSWTRALGDTASYAVGEATPVAVPSAALGELRLGPLICFESAFGALARRHRTGGARLLVNVTNDAWFGGGLPGKAARAQHEAHLVIRAVENGIPVARAANGGSAMFVHASGAARTAAPAGEETVLVETLHVPDPPRGGTPIAGLVGPLCALATVALLLWGTSKSIGE